MLLTFPLLLALAAAADPSAPQFIISTIAGSDASGDYSLGTAVPLLQPEGVAVDSAGNVYIADAADNRIRKLAPTGFIESIAGTGRPGFSGDGGVATSAELNQPYGIAVDQAGDVYIADLGNARVRRIDTHGIITTVAGGGTSAVGSSSGGVDALKAKLNSPRNVATASDGSQYISDFGGHYVYRLSSSGTLTIVAGTGSAGFSGDNGPADVAQVAYPAGLTVGSDGSLYIADSGNARVRRVSNGVITTAAQVPEVVDVALTATDTLYVAAAGVLGNPNSPFAGSASLSPRSLAINPEGNVVFSNATFVEVVDWTGAYTTIAGTGTVAFGDGGAATAARLLEPAGSAIDPAGNLYIADSGENRIREVNAKGLVSTIYGDGDPKKLNGPRSLALASDGSLLIADTGNARVLKLTAPGTVATVLDQLSTPSYLFAAPSGDLYIAETSGDRITRLAADGTTSFLPVVQPLAVVGDTQGNLFVAQSGSSQVLQFGSSGWGSAIGTGLGQPNGLAIDADGNLLVADVVKSEVVSISPTGSVTTLAGTGTAGFGGDGGPAASGFLSGPSDVKVDSQGRVYVADTGNGRIRLLTPQSKQANFSSLQVVSAASFAQGPISPDEIVSIFGDFDPSSVSIQIGGQEATLFYAGATQVNALVPHAMSVGAPVTLSVQQNNSAAQSITLNTANATPALFTIAGGTGQAAALNQDNKANSSAQPCARGDVISLYGTGFGSGNVSVNIGGESAIVSFAGFAPGSPGLMQVNATVPSDLASIGNIPVAVSIGGASSQSGVTIAVR